MEQFSALSAQELNDLKDALPLIAIYIAGADGIIDNEEKMWAEKVTHIRGYNLKGAMKEFYQEADAIFHNRLEELISTLPQDVVSRNSYIEAKLAGLNPILAKLDLPLGAKMYTGFKSYAEHVAKASGGVMGFFTINKDEAALLGLSMIAPIVFDEEE
jgi:hypothetical protein